MLEPKPKDETGEGLKPDGKVEEKPQGKPEGGKPGEKPGWIEKK
jgi:hypothetical protein